MEQTTADLKAQLEPYLNSITTKKGKAYICPICKSGTGPHKTPAGNITDKSYHCFACGFHGDIFDLIGAVEGIQGSKERFKRVRELFGINDSIQSHKGLKEARSAPETRLDYSVYFLQAKERLYSSPEALSYIQSRRISQETANRFTLGYDVAWRSPKAVREGKNPPPSRRLIIPTSKYSYLARAIDENTDQKYKAVKEGKVELFNKTAITNGGHVFVVEGEIDALSVIEAGAEAVGLGGASNAQKLVELCKSTPKLLSVILSLDNDATGKNTQAKLRASLESLKISILEANIAGEYKDANEHMQKAPELFKQAVEGALEAAVMQKEAEREAEREKYQNTNTANYIQSFINGIADSVNTPYIPTGFQSLDKELDGGLFEGLYVLGAITSLGKTSFILQAADQIAQTGEDVLIFSLEMARTELMSKSISRETFMLSPNAREAKTARGVTTGKRYPGYSVSEKELIKQAINEYGQYAENIYISEGLGDIGVMDIREAVRKHISITGKKPVVIIDYLQLLAPYEIRATDKQNTDKAVLELKRISRDYKIPVVAISSFNRQNYSQKVTMEAFKESGAIEYSSDILIGLQAKGAGTSGFDIDTAKRLDPREIELKILKNRNGATGGKVEYVYYPLFNFFKEV